MMTLIYTVGGVLVFGFVLAGLIAYANGKANDAALAAVPDFTATYYCGRIALDVGRTKLCLIEGALRPARVFAPADIVSVELVENGRTVTKTSRSSQIGGAALGTLVLGPLGTVIGGLSGKTTSTSKIDSFHLRIVVIDASAPVHETNFGPDAMGAREWHGRVAGLIKMADLEATRASTPPSSVADELAKLAALRDAGTLTSVEFDVQKQKLLT